MAGWSQRLAARSSDSPGRNEKGALVAPTMSGAREQIVDRVTVLVQYRPLSVAPDPAPPRRPVQWTAPPTPGQASTARPANGLSRAAPPSIIVQQLGTGPPKKRANPVPDSVGAPPGGQGWRHGHASVT
jgi:hypothetical protein